MTAASMDRTRTPEPADRLGRGSENRRIRKVLAGARVRSGISATELADKLGIASSTLSMIENGRRSLKRSLLDEIRLHIDLTDDEYKELCRESRKGPEYKAKLAEQILTREIIDNPEKCEALVGFARALSADHSIEEFIAGHRDNAHLEYSAKNGSKVECDWRRSPDE